MLHPADQTCMFAELQTPIHRQSPMQATEAAGAAVRKFLLLAADLGLANALSQSILTWSARLLLATQSFSAANIMCMDQHCV